MGDFPSTRVVRAEKNLVHISTSIGHGSRQAPRTPELAPDDLEDGNGRVSVACLSRRFKRRFVPGAVEQCLLDK